MMKKILLALALASASSLFAVDNMGQWFNATPVDAETPVPWSLNGEDGSVITNLTDTAFWEIDADVTKAGGEEATVFTPPAQLESGLYANTITRVDISTTFDAMYDMTTEEGHPENFVGEDQPLPPPQGSLGALVVGSTTNAPEGVVVSSNFYAWVWTGVDPNDTTKKTGTWFPLYGADIPDSLTGKVAHVRIELLYLYGMNKLRYSIGKVDGSGVTNYVALADADGETLFPFETSGENITGVEFSGCGKVYQVASAVRSYDHFDGGKGTETEPYLLASADAFLELAHGAATGEYNLGINSKFRMEADVSLPSWTAIGGDGENMIAWSLFDGNHHTITINNLTGGGFFSYVNAAGLAGGVNIKNLTIVASNATDNAADTAIFAHTCVDNVNFVNCTAAGQLYNTTSETGKLSGFVLYANATDPSTTSVTFDNCLVTAELNAANAYAFVADVGQGKVKSEADTTIATVGGYESYGALDSAGSVDCAFNFCTNDTINEVEYTFYVEPKLSPMGAETIPTYWVAKENADEFEFNTTGKLKLAYDGHKFPDAPYDVANKLTATAAYVVENEKFDDPEYTETQPPSFVDSEGFWFCDAFVNPCVATTTWYGESGEESEDESQEESQEIELGVQKHSGVARAFAASYSGEGDPTRTVVALCANAEAQADVGVYVEFELGGYVLTIAEDSNSTPGNFEVGDGGILSASPANPLDNLSIQLLEDPTGESENRVTFLSGATVYGNGHLWLDYDGFTEDDTPAFARLASDASIKVTNVDNTKKDFLFSGEGTTIYSFDAAGGNDTYTLADGAIVALNGSLSADKLQAPLGSGLCITKVEDSENSYTTGQAVCMVNGKGYATFAEALAAAGDGATIDLVGEQTVTITETTIGKNLFITNSTGTGMLTIGGAVTIAAGKTLNLSGFTLDADLTISDGGSFAIAATGTLQMDDVDPTTAFGDSYAAFFTGSADGAIFIGDKTYTWNDGAWQGEQPVVNYVCQIVVDAETTNKYETLQAAIDAATSGQTVQMIADASVEFDTAVCIDIVAGKSITLELNGKKLTGRGTLANANDFIRVRYGAELTIQDTVSGGEIAYVCTNPDQSYGYGTYGIHNYGVLNLLSGKVSADCDNTGHGGITYAVANAVTTANQSAVFNMFGGELYLTKGDQSLYMVYNNVTDNSATNIVNITGGTITGKEGTSKGIFMGLNGGTPCMALNISGSAVVEGVLDVLRANDNCSINISGGNLDISKLRIRNSCTNTKPFFNISSGTVKIDAYDVAETIATPIEITGGTFTNVAATDEKTKSFVPEVVCTITDNEGEPATYTVAKVPVSLLVVKDEHVQSVVYTINGLTVDVNPTVVYGDVVEIGAITCEYGWEADTIKEGDKIEMTLDKMVSGGQLVNPVTITIDATERTFFGGGDGSEATPYIINAAQHLIDLKDYVAAGQPTVGKYFKQETDIDMAGMPPWPGIGAGAAGKRFSGVYDGGNRTIRNMTLAKFSAEEKAGVTFYKYNRGLFNATDGATIMNLIVETLGFEADATNIGGGTLIGYVLGGTMISNVTTKGTLVSDYTSGGMVGALGEATPLAVDGMDLTFVDCVNEVNVSSTKDKIGGFLAYAGYTSKTGVKFIRCVNKGTITNQPASGEGNGGAAEFIGWAGNSAPQTFTDCVAQGSVTSTDSTTKVGTFIGRKDAGKATMATGTNVASASLPAIGTADATIVTNLSFATVAGDVATFVADDVFLSAINATAADYKLMSSAGTAMLEAGAWKFDVSLFDADALKVATDTNINSAPEKSEAVVNVVTVTVTPQANSEGVFEVVATVDAAGKSGNIKITTDDAKKVAGYSEITSLADITDVSAFQAALNDTGTDGVPVWQKLVLGLAPDQKPTVKATQDAVTDKVTFTLGTLKEVDDIRATGAKVKFYVVDGELKEVGDTLTLPISSLFGDGKKVERITVKVVVDQANQKPQD